MEKFVYVGEFIFVQDFKRKRYVLQLTHISTISVIVGSISIKRARPIDVVRNLI